MGTDQGRTPRPAAGGRRPRSRMPKPPRIRHPAPCTASPPDSPGGGGEPAASDIAYGNAAHGSRDNADACSRGPGTPAQDQRGGARRGSVARGAYRQGPAGGRPRGHAADLPSREAKRENQACRKAKIGYSTRWVAGRGVFHFRVRIRRTRDGPQVVEHHPGDTAQGGPVQQVEGRVDSPRAGEGRAAHDVSVMPPHGRSSADIRS